MNKWISRILWAAAVLFMIIQVVMAAFYTLPYPDCIIGLKDAAYVYDGRGIVWSAPIMSLWGLVGRLTGIAPAYLALHILPFIIIPACYLAYGYAAVTLNGNSIKAPAMVLVIELLNLFGFQSEILSPYTLLLGWYRGEAICVHLILPLLLTAYIKWRDKHPIEERAVKEEMWQVEEDDAEDEMKHKYLNVRNLGIAFIVFVIVVMGAVLVLNRKINNLHEATVNLQNVIEEKGEYIEFKGALGESSEGYIMVDADDNVTVMFGGAYEDGAALYEILAEYGNHVTSWYLKDDGEQGAFEYCRENGTVIDHIYTIGGIEEL